MPISESTLAAFESSLARTNATPLFLDRFYEVFLASSPIVRQKFAHTDFARQKQALRTSFDLMLSTARDPGDHAELLRDLAEHHSSRDLNIGAALYDQWLDSLLAAVSEFDPEYSDEVRAAWEQVMMAGIQYLLRYY